MNQIDLNGKNAIVTGGARGIGLAITQRLLASGAEQRDELVVGAQLQQRARDPEAADGRCVEG